MVLAVFVADHGALALATFEAQSNGESLARTTAIEADIYCTLDPDHAAAITSNAAIDIHISRSIWLSEFVKYSRIGEAPWCNEGRAKPPQAQLPRVNIVQQLHPFLCSPTLEDLKLRT